MRIRTTPIDGLLVVEQDVFDDERGWFKENWQRAKLAELGFPDFTPVQQSVSVNLRRGVTRGVHAEPWEKFVTALTGSAYGAWVDLREGEGLGRTVTHEIEPGTLVFVPRGVGNSYQALADHTVYSYLVNEHWRPDLRYPALALDDPDAAIDWPIPLDHAQISDKDRANPRLAGVTPFAPRRPLRARPRPSSWSTISPRTPNGPGSPSSAPARAGCWCPRRHAPIRRRGGRSPGSGGCSSSSW